MREWKPMGSPTVACVLVALLAAACGDGEPAGEMPETPGAEPGVEEAAVQPEPSRSSVTVYFTRDEQPVGVERATPVPTASLAPSAAMLELVRGPTAEEEAEGITSWFSQETANQLRAVSMGGDGHVVVDFHDLREVIPGASSSTGSELLLTELNETLFQFPDVRSVEYQIDGSCETFWNWLQYDCQIVRRQDG